MVNNLHPHRLVKQIQTLTNGKRLSTMEVTVITVFTKNMPLLEGIRLLLPAEVGLLLPELQVLII